MEGPPATTASGGKLVSVIGQDITRNQTPPSSASTSPSADALRPAAMSRLNTLYAAQQQHDQMLLYMAADEDDNGSLVDDLQEEEEEDDSPWRPKGSSRKKSGTAKAARLVQGRKKRKLESIANVTNKTTRLLQPPVDDDLLPAAVVVKDEVFAQLPSQEEEEEEDDEDEEDMNCRDAQGIESCASASSVTHMLSSTAPSLPNVDSSKADPGNPGGTCLDSPMSSQLRRPPYVLPVAAPRILNPTPSPSFLAPPAFTIHPLHPAKVKSPGNFITNFSHHSEMFQQQQTPQQQQPATQQQRHTQSDEALQVQESMPVYPNAAAAPSRLPAHKPVRLKQPKHPLAREGTPVFFKYGEEHYPEETVPEPYTFTESDGTVCRYITNFLVYNKRGERLLPIEVLDQPRHGALVLYGSLLPATVMSAPGGCERPVSRAVRTDKRRSSSRRRGEDEFPGKPPYPIRVELSEWCIDYGQEPHNVPFIWLISRWDVYYRLEKPAGRYIPTFSTAKMKFEVSTRIIKTLQWRPDFPYRDLVDLLTAASRQERKRRRLEEEKKRRSERRASIRKHRGGGGGGEELMSEEGSDDDIFARGGTGGCDGDDGTRKKNPRPNWKVHSSLSTPEGTGVVVKLADGQSAPVTPWNAAFAVEGLRESNLLGLTDFLESQMRNFLEGVGGTCANLLDTRFMQTLREKASIRRETLQLVEAKKRSIESMTAANGFTHIGAGNPFDLGSVSPPLVAVQVLQPVPVRQPLCQSISVVQGCAMTSQLVTIGFGTDANNPHHHQAMMLLKSRHQEEQELNQLLHLLKEFSDPEERGSIHPGHQAEDCDTEEEEELGNSDQDECSSDIQNCRPSNATDVPKRSVAGSSPA